MGFTLILATLDGLDVDLLGDVIGEDDCNDDGEFTLSSLDVLQGFSFFLQIGFILILATLEGLDVGLLGDIIGEDDYDNDVKSVYSMEEDEVSLVDGVLEGALEALGYDS
ncbi:hypothetical protein Tco_0634766 [Tanacetum coccineum]